jgi:hypothetical protein
MRIRFSALVLASAALAAVALSTIPAMATTGKTLNVPFSFTVNGKTLPAGEYYVVRDDSRHFVGLQSSHSSESFLWVANPSETKTDRVVLKFNPQGNTHELESVQYGPLVTSKLNGKSKKAEDVSPQFTPGQ